MALQALILWLSPEAALAPVSRPLQVPLFGAAQLFHDFLTRVECGILCGAMTLFAKTHCKAIPF